MKSLQQSLSSAGWDLLLNHETNRVGADQHDCNEIEKCRRKNSRAMTPCIVRQSTVS